MLSHGIFHEVNTEVGQIIVADVNHERISELFGAGSASAGQADSKGEITRTTDDHF